MPVLNATEPERNDGNTENQNIIVLVVKPGVRYVAEPEKELGIMQGNRESETQDTIRVQATIQFKIHKYGVMNDEKGIFNNASDQELLDYCIDNFEGNCRSVDGYAIEISIIKGVR